MPGVEILGRTRVDKDQIGVIAMLPEPSRIDNFFSFFRIHWLDLSVYSDRFTNRTESTAMEQVRQSRRDSLDHARTLVDERGV